MFFHISCYKTYFDSKSFGFPFNDIDYKVNNLVH